MTKKLFLIFTLVMVFLTGLAFYEIISSTGKQQAKRIEAKLPQKQAAVSPTPRQPTPKAEENNVNTEEPGLKSLTNGQKYYTALSSADCTNVLLIGKDPTYSNFDTLIVVCVDEKNETVRLVDLPRDIYIDYSKPILDRLQETDGEFLRQKGSRKLNAAHVVGRKTNYSPENERFPGKTEINFLTDLIDEIFGIGIDDYMAIETDGFREMVDFFGGVVVDVPYPMHYEDPVQDLYIHLDPGLQLLDGEKAEGFVRFRQGYDRNGRLVSYSRSENTFLFLKSFFKQHVTLRNLTKAGKVFEIVRENTKTSVQSIGDAYQYVLVLKNILEKNYTIESVMVECTATKNIDGALYDFIRTK